MDLAFRLSLGGHLRSTLADLIRLMLVSLIVQSELALKIKGHCFLVEAEDDDE